MRRSLLTVQAPALPGVNIGDAFKGGYYAGIMDTTQGNIITNDASQVGSCYALIVSPKSLESASAQWKNSNDAGPVGVQTRWDGLSATTAMALAENSSVHYPAATYCDQQASFNDGASSWYLPAMDELELIYRNLKCSTESNTTSARTGSTFPGGSQSMGYNPSSAPPGVAYTTSVPGQTSATAFQSGQTQALGSSGTNVYYWTATEYASAYAWVQVVSGSIAGNQANNYKSTSYRVRPVRRLALNFVAPGLVITQMPDGSVTNSTTPVAAWTPILPQGAIQARYRVVWEADGFGTAPGSGSPLADTGVVISSNTSALAPTAFPQSGFTVRQFVKIWGTGGKDSGWKYTTFNYSYRP